MGQLKAANRIKEFSITEGTEALALLGAMGPTFRTFVDGIGDGNYCEYCVVGASGFETGIGKVHAGDPPLLHRLQVEDSSNGGELVDFGPEEKTVMCVFGANMIARVFDMMDAGGYLPEMPELPVDYGPERVFMIDEDKTVSSITLANLEIAATYENLGGTYVWDPENPDSTSVQGKCIAVDMDYVYVGSGWESDPRYEAEIHKLNKSDLSFVASYTGYYGTLFCLVAGSDGYLYASGRSGEIHKLDPSDMSFVQSYLAISLKDFDVRKMVWGGDGYLYAIAGVEVGVTGPFDGSGEVHQINPSDMSTVGIYNEDVVNAEMWTSMAWGGDGYLYIAGSGGDIEAGAVRRIDPSTMSMTAEVVFHPELYGALTFRDMIWSGASGRLFGCMQYGSSNRMFQITTENDAEADPDFADMWVEKVESASRENVLGSISKAAVAVGRDGLLYFGGWSYVCPTDPDELEVDFAFGDHVEVGDMCMALCSDVPLWILHGWALDENGVVSEYPGVDFSLLTRVDPPTWDYEGTMTVGYKETTHYQFYGYENYGAESDYGSMDPAPETFDTIAAYDYNPTYYELYIDMQALIIEIDGVTYYLNPGSWSNKTGLTVNPLEAVGVGNTCSIKILYNN